MTSPATAAPFDASVMGRTWSQAGESLQQVISTPGFAVSSSIRNPSPSTDLAGDWLRAYMRGEEPTAVGSNGALRVVDLFCGPGGLGLGVRQACRELGIRFESRLAVDRDSEALAVYRRNLAPTRTSSDSVSSLVDFHVKGSRGDARFHYEPEVVDESLEDLVGGVDAVVGGPPCQGHSNLNNKTRRDDRRNDLYLTMPAMAVALGARIVIIENVPAVVHDVGGVVETTTALLRDSGYAVEAGVFNSADFGWPQNRNRFFLVARRDAIPVSFDDVEALLRADARSITWAIDDLADAERGFMTDLPDFSDENRSRIDYLFDHNVYDLPNTERPDCHKDGTTYNAVYGRLYPDRAAPTITTGFVTPGRGRYIHPTRRRVLTPLEAARLQGFPDDYCFEPASGTAPKRASLTKWIGDAVPMPLGYAATLAALGNGWR